MHTSRPRLWTKDFIIISFASFLLGLIFFLTMSTLVVYAIEEFNASQSKAGLSASILIIGSILARVFTGKYLEIVGRKKLLYIGIILSFVANLLYFPASNLNILIIVRFFHGAVLGITLTVLQTSVMNLIPISRRGEGISYYSLSFILATAIGPFLGVFITQYSNMSTIFIVCSVFSAISVILSLFVSIPEVKLTKEQLKDLRGFHIKDFFEKKALPISLLTGIFGFSYSSILSFLAPYSIEIQLMSAASFFFIVYSFFVLISRPFTGVILDLKGDNIVMFPAILFFSAGLFIISQAGNGITLLLAGAFIGLGYGNLQSAAQAIVIKNSPSHRVGLATSTFFICVEGGMGIGPFLLGYLLPITGYRNMYIILGIIVLVCIVLYYFLHGKKKAFDQQISHVNVKHES
ncbi:MFS transporter [Neobacillus sp. FSL H8-0543]|uniref:MFS transporter n=1 Tax=Neobacillus sp. FSL H8-0543 TaxID=2954672 RepID=UPI0031596038